MYYVERGFTRQCVSISYLIPLSFKVKLYIVIHLK
jgi:hypothetical protein